MIIFSMPSVALASSLLHFGPAGRHPFLQPARAWRRAAVAAPVLVLRPPRSLHHLPAGDGLRQRDRRDLLPPAGVRLSGRRAGAGLDRDPRLRPVGPPHVRDRPAARRLQLLHRREHDGRDPDRACRSSAGSRRCGTAARASQVPMLYVVGFIVTFVIGGLTGVMVAAVPLDLQLHDTYFIVAHFHYVLIGGAVFPLLGALTYWYPEDHRPDDERSARQDRLLDGLPRLPARLLPDALQRAARHAAAGLHLSRRAWASSFPTCCRRIGAFVVARGGAAVRRQRHRVALPRRDRARPIRGARRPSNGRRARRRRSTISRTSRSSKAARRCGMQQGELPVVTGLRVDEKEMLLTTVVAAAPDLREPVAGAEPVAVHRRDRDRRRCSSPRSSRPGRSCSARSRARSR